MRIELCSVFVADQEKALRFYTEILGFTKRTDIPIGEYRFLTVASPAGAEGVELFLEPNAHPAAAAYQKAIHDDGIPATVFFTPDVQGEHERLKKLGVVFATAPTETEHGWQAVFDDTCGNLILLQQR
ncbi:MAG: VOC family protein [Candidatus Eisenbacteria bacterium]